MPSDTPPAPDAALREKLKALMAKATPGPFVIERDDLEGGYISYGVWCHAPTRYCQVASFDTLTNSNAKRDAEVWCATMNNLSTILAALSRDAGADGWRAGAEAMREAAADVALPGSKPCACITKDGDWWQQNCDCSNSGDLAEAQSWCSERNLAYRIRALPLPAPPAALAAAGEG